VTPGDGRGRQLGFPTANLLVPPEKLIPADGVYVVDVLTSGVQQRAVMSIGNRPTFDRPRALEVYLLDFEGNLYGQSLAITFLARLRGVQAFASVDALLEQIRQDIALARSY
jgi:riboflavin kinase/FMN adenylyltransferase